jgi:hypothetical protein
MRLTQGAAGAGMPPSLGYDVQRLPLVADADYGEGGADRRDEKGRQRWARRRGPSGEDLARKREALRVSGREIN